MALQVNFLKAFFYRKLVDIILKSNVNRFTNNVAASKFESAVSYALDACNSTIALHFLRHEARPFIRLSVSLPP
jgi:hypothetical protein